MKLPLDLVLSEEFCALGPAAQSVWLRAWVIAKKCNADGLLVDNGAPIALARLSTPDVPPRKVPRIIDDLVAAPFPRMRDVGFFIERASGILEVTGWKRAQFGGESGERMARLRAGGSEAMECVTSDVTCDAQTDAHPPPQGVTSDAEKPHNGEIAPSQVTHRAIESPSSSGDKSPSSSGSAAPLATLPSWAEKIRGAVREFADAQLHTLSFEQRLSLGQYAAFRWAKCTSDESKNVRKARDQFAPQIESIGAKPRFAKMLVREFIGAGNHVWEETRRLPIHSLWAITAAIEQQSEGVA